MIRLNAGAYHIVSTYGDANATVRADVTVEPGKITEATVKHAAAPVTFKLVQAAGGEALADTKWSILTTTGDVVKESDRRATDPYPGRRRLCRGRQPRRRKLHDEVQGRGRRSRSRSRWSWSKVRRRRRRCAPSPIRRRRLPAPGRDAGAPAAPDEPAWPLARAASAATWRYAAAWRAVLKSGGTASSAIALTTASSVMTCCSWLPSRRSDTVPSSASRLPTTTRTGTLASECSRTL